MARFVVHKHLHGFVQDTDGGSMPGAGGDTQRRGHLDIVGLQFDGKQSGRQLPPAVLAQVKALFPFVNLSWDFFCISVGVHLCMILAGMLYFIDACLSFMFTHPPGD